METEVTSTAAAEPSVSAAAPVTPVAAQTTPTTPAAATAVTPAAASTSVLGHVDPATGTLKPGWAKAAGLPEAWEKKYTTADSVFKSHASLEKMYGSLAGNPNKVTIPGPNATPEERAEFFTKLGRPAKPEDYGLAQPEKIGDKVVPKGFVDQALLGEFAKTAHDLGLTKEQAAKLVEFDTARGLKASESMNLQVEQSRTLAMDALKKDWGSDYDNQLKLAETAAREAGFSGADYPDLGNHPGFIKAMAKIGAKFVETPAAGARGTTHAVTNPKAEIDSMMADRTHPIWLKNHPGHAAAVSRRAQLMEQLHGRVAVAS